MSEGVIAALLTTLGALFGGGLTYWTKRRTSSGSIDTSEAQELWAESTQLRLALREQIADRDLVIERLEAAIAALRKENADLWVRINARRGV